jgi:hypothetical protein
MLVHIHVYARVLLSLAGPACIYVTCIVGSPDQVTDRMCDMSVCWCCLNRLVVKNVVRVTPASVADAVSIRYSSCL